MSRRKSDWPISPLKSFACRRRKWIALSPVKPRSSRRGTCWGSQRFWVFILDWWLDNFSTEPGVTTAFGNISQTSWITCALAHQLTGGVMFTRSENRRNPLSKIAQRLMIHPAIGWIETGETDVDMHAVARMAMQQGWKAPPPITEEDRLAKLFKSAARQDIRHDRKTGHAYRGYHAVPKQTKDGQLAFSYMDIDDPRAKPGNFRKACVMRREQSVDDQLQLRLDQIHWNDQRPPGQHVEILPARL